MDGVDGRRCCQLVKSVCLEFVLRIYIRTWLYSDERTLQHYTIERMAPAT